MSRNRIGLVACVLAAVLLSAARVGAQERLDENTRLAALAKTWGLLKYYGAGAASRGVDWDAALLEAIPRVRAADTKTAFNDELLRLLRVADEHPAQTMRGSAKYAALDPLFRWLDDRAVLDDDVAAQLKAIRYQTVGANRYVRATPGTSQADFSGEAPYAAPEYPARDYRLLALFRYWNMVQYFFPNRGLIDRDWDDVLAAAIPRFDLASDATSYHLAAAALTASINDTHASTSSTVLWNHWGPQMAPVETRLLGGQTVVMRVFTRFTQGADVRPGDVITAIDDVPIETARANLRPYMRGSNAGSLELSVDGVLLRTARAEVRLALERDGVVREVVVTCPPYADVANEAYALDKSVVSRVLAGNIGYVNMGALQPSDVDATMSALRNTAAIVFDVRNYPNGTIQRIMSFLSAEPRSFVRFTMPDMTAPGTFRVIGDAVAGPSAGSTVSAYPGRVLVLFDERTISHAEYTCMAFRTLPNSTLVGSPTSGADGDVSMILLPGGIRTYFSGIGVFYPEGGTAQRVGVVPDVLVRPTRAGVAAGVDEILEAALALVR